jgi:hypothetical protein
LFLLTSGVTRCYINVYNQYILFQTVNIPNAYEDERFDPSVDEGSCFRHKTILCMAIKNSSGQIIGVIQVRTFIYQWLKSFLTGSLRVRSILSDINFKYFVFLSAHQQI